MIRRILHEKIRGRLFKGKAIILLGARQVGKSTLIEDILRDTDHLYLNGDDADVRDMLSNTTATRLRAEVGSNRIVFIDEAQRIPDIGLALKLFTDQIKSVQVIATGSSAFELSGKINEPLTGRKYEFLLYPLSFAEMAEHHGLTQERRLVPHRLIYGYYPEMVTKPGEETELLKLLADSLLYKDLLVLDQIKKPLILSKLLRALALQLGSEVSYQELAQTVGSDPKTVDKYIDLLEKAFVLFRLNAFSRNVRNEIKKGKKIYFYDCGIRNAVIGNFRPINARADAGALWENFAIAERMKHRTYANMHAEQYFWRTTQQQEIDLIEETHDGLCAYEFKWSPSARARLPSTFATNYPQSEFRVVTPKNAEDFLL